MADFSNRLDAHGRGDIKFYATPRGNKYPARSRSRLRLVKQVCRVTPTQATRLLQQIATEGLGLSSKYLLGRASVAGGQSRGHDRFEEVTGGTIADVEAVTHDGKPHGVGAVQEPTVFDGLNPEVIGNRGRPAAVPAGAMARLGLRAAHAGGSIQLTWRAGLAN